MKTSSKPKSDVRSGGSSGARRGASSFPAAGALAGGLLAVLVAQGSAWASPGAFEPLSTATGAGSNLNLGLDGRTAGRLLADARASDDETPKAMDKPDDVKLTVLKGDDAKRASAPPDPGKKDSFAFVKDWPFWVIVGGVIVAGAATYMLVQNSNQKHTCLLDTFSGGCHGAN